MCKFTHDKKILLTLTKKRKILLIYTHQKPIKKNIYIYTHQTYSWIYCLSYSYPKYLILIQVYICYDVFIIYYNNHTGSYINVKNQTLVFFSFGEQKSNTS
jgi:hypothetical protein